MGDIFGRYLRLLGVQPEPPSRDLLGSLVRAQLYRVPFENVSKLYYGRSRGHRFMPDLERHLDGIEHYHFGGTCYPNNSHFHLLLRHLGYEVKLCGADMSTPDAHLVSMVTLGAREYLVDVGYAAPFDEPLPLDLDEALEIRLGRQRYVLHPRDADGRSRMDHYRDDILIHGYLAKPEPRSLEEFHTIIEDSYRPAATFMNTVVAERFSPGQSVRVHGLELIQATGRDVTKRALGGLEELVDVLVDRFGMPEAMVREAITSLDLSGDIYG